MVTAIIPHFVSVPRFRGRPCLLTRMELLPVGRDLISSLARGPNPTRILVANCLEWPKLSDSSWLNPTQECGFYEFATSVNTCATRGKKPC